MFFQPSKKPGLLRIRVPRCWTWDGALRSPEEPGQTPSLRLRLSLGGPWDHRVSAGSLRRLNGLEPSRNRVTFPQAKGKNRVTLQYYVCIFLLCSSQATCFASFWGAEKTFFLVIPSWNLPRCPIYSGVTASLDVTCHKLDGPFQLPELDGIGKCDSSQSSYTSGI
jgi:hypothetical protein